MLSILDLFSGIGGFSYAAERLVGGFSTKQFVEINPYCCSVLSKNWPDVPIHDDIQTYTASVKSFDVITAGFPCQDLSTAGKQAGLRGERSGLFYEIMRLVRDIQPQFLVLENVANLVSHANGETFQEVLYQIAQAGFDAEWAVIPASDVGACHRRARIWIVAYAPHMLSNGSPGEYQGQLGRQSLSESRNRDRADVANTNNKGPQRRQSTIVCERGTERSTWTRNTPSSLLTPDWRSYVSEPVLCQGDDGLSGRVDRLKALGNAVVPQVASVALQRVKDLAAVADSWVDAK
jgi:DNA (cytosine-5)-methyltransferase 1